MEEQRLGFLGRRWVTGQCWGGWSPGSLETLLGDSRPGGTLKPLCICADVPKPPAQKTAHIRNLTLRWVLLLPHQSDPMASVTSLWITWQQLLKTRGANMVKYIKLTCSEKIPGLGFWTLSSRRPLRAASDAKSFVLSSSGLSVCPSLAWNSSLKPTCKT